MYDSIVYKKLSTSKYELQGKRKLFFRSYPHLKDNFVHKFRFMVLADFSKEKCNMFFFYIFKNVDFLFLYKHGVNTKSVDRMEF